MREISLLFLLFLSFLSHHSNQILSKKTISLAIEKMYRSWLIY